MRWLYLIEWKNKFYHLSFLWTENDRTYFLDFHYNAGAAPKLSTFNFQFSIKLYMGFTNFNIITYNKLCIKKVVSMKKVNNNSLF